MPEGRPFVEVVRKALGEKSPKLAGTSADKRILVLDLYCPGFSSAEALSKEANLVRTAVRYKVDASKMTARVTAELSTKRKGRRFQRRNSTRVGRNLGKRQTEC